MKRFVIDIIIRCYLSCSQVRVSCACGVCFVYWFAGTAVSACRWFDVFFTCGLVCGLCVIDSAIVFFSCCDVGSLFRVVIVFLFCAISYHACLFYRVVCSFFCFRIVCSCRIYFVLCGDVILYFVFLMCSHVFFFFSLIVLVFVRVRECVSVYVRILCGVIYFVFLYLLYSWNQWCEKHETATISDENMRWRWWRVSCVPWFYCIP